MRQAARLLYIVRSIHRSVQLCCNHRRGPYVGSKCSSIRVFFPSFPRKRKIKINKLLTNKSSPTRSRCVFFSGKAREKNPDAATITLTEILIAIKALANEKSPGCDGLTAEFYITFSSVIGNDLVDVVNNGFQKGELSITMRRGVIVLIPKGGEKKLLKNWRPISLLNYDYKIITKVLTSRLRDIMPTIIHPNQKCGINGRSIHDGAH